MKISSNDYAVHNYLEDIADQAIGQVLSEESTACSCHLCRDDIKSYMLNQLKPHYYAITPEEEIRKPVLEKLETKLFNQVMVECYTAVLKVKQKPRHNHTRSAVQNSTERMAIWALRDILSSEHIHLDRTELSKLVAIILNDLKPQYTTTLKGDVFCRTLEMDSAYIAKVYTSIYNALKELQVLQTS